MSVLCCSEADGSNGAEHAQWCPNFDWSAHVAAAERRGWAQAIEALRDDGAHLFMLGHLRYRIEGCTCGWDELGKSHVKHVLDRLGDYLTARAAALTEEGPDVD